VGVPVASEPSRQLDVEGVEGDVADTLEEPAMRGVRRRPRPAREAPIRADFEAKVRGDNEPVSGKVPGFIWVNPASGS